jgi:hypothetical protein
LPVASPVRAPGRAARLRLPGPGPVDWIRMAYEEAKRLPPNSKPEMKDVMGWLRAKRMA